MMYSVRKITQWHGNTNLYLLVYNIVLTAILIWQFGIDYLIIFCSSTILHLIIESGLAISGIRKGLVTLYGRKLPRTADVIFRSLVEGPAFCVPAFFVADQLMAGEYVIGIVGSVFLVGIPSLYVGWDDWRNLRRLGPGEEAQMSRRAMNKPKGIMLLALINIGCLSALFLMPAPFRTHAFTYMIAYTLLVMLFYLITNKLGVRMVEIYDYESKMYYMPGPLFQAAGLSYVSVYEMALFLSPSYWLTFYLGLFHYATIA